MIKQYCDKCGCEIEKKGMTHEIGWVPKYDYSVEMEISTGNTGWNDLCVDCVCYLVKAKIELRYNNE